MGGEGRGSFDW